VSIEVLGKDSDWGGALPSNIAAIAASVAQCFADAVDEKPLPNILLQPTSSAEDWPLTSYTLAANGSIRILLPVRGNYWARFVYQFAHELCHALVGIHPGRKADWLEESLCEAASLFALGSTARSWVCQAPYPVWQDYAPRLEEYLQNRKGEPEHQIPSNITFAAWFRGRLPELQRNATARRDYNTIVAMRLLQVFQGAPAAWRAIRYLDSWAFEPTRDVRDVFASWRQATPARLRHFVAACERLLLQGQRQLNRNGAAAVVSRVLASSVRGERKDIDRED
jgi:hypothetical protein